MSATLPIAMHGKRRRRISSRGCGPMIIPTYWEPYGGACAASSSGKSFAARAPAGRIQTLVTVRLAPSACTTLTRLPAGTSGPATRQMGSSIRTVPEPSMIGFSSVNTRPASASARLLRNGLLSLTEVLLRAMRRHSGTAAAAKIANVRICSCQDGLMTNDNSPTSNAASPSQNKNTPGAINSSAIRMTPKISQFQVPSVANISVIGRPSARRRHRQDGAGIRPRRSARGGGRGCRAFPNGDLGDFADAGERSQNAHRLDRQHDDLLVRRIRQLPERLDVFVGDKLIQRGHIALGDGLASHLRRLGL